MKLSPQEAAELIVQMASILAQLPSGNACRVRVTRTRWRRGAELRIIIPHVGRPSVQKAKAASRLQRPP